VNVPGSDLTSFSTHRDEVIAHVLSRVAVQACKVGFRRSSIE
jgi:hypothetical protein